MSSLAEAYGVSQAQWEDRAARERRVEQAYQAVFDGQPSPSDQRLVRDDLEIFCGMRSTLMRETFQETGRAVGRLDVWQRVHRFRFPRPADAPISEGGQHDRSTREQHQPIPGGGVAEPTTD